MADRRPGGVAAGQHHRQRQAGCGFTVTSVPAAAPATRISRPADPAGRSEADISVNSE
jgi:hypothetical protein